MNHLQKYLSTCLLATGALLVGASPAWAQTAPALGTASSFAVLSAADKGGGAVTCTDSTIIGDVGSSGARASVVTTRCKITGAIIAPVSDQVVTAFDDAYASLALTQCDKVLTTLDGQTLSPGVYCFDSYVASTGGVLTLDGPANGIWIFKVGTSGTGYLEGTNFTMNLVNGALACNVYWWVAQYATLTDSDFKGTILAGAAITITGTAGTPPTPFEGRALAKAAVTLTDVAFVGCEGGSRGGKSKSKCNQGIGNGPEQCDPGNSNQDGNPSPFPSTRSNDELGGAPRNPGPGRKGGNNN